jgi:hypothetical protein
MKDGFPNYNSAMMFNSGTKRLCGEFFGNISVLAVDCENLRHSSQQRVKDFWIELRATAFFHDRQRLLRQVGFLVGARCGQRIEHIRNAGNSTFDWNIFTGQAARVSLTVPPLVMRVRDATGQRQQRRFSAGAYITMHSNGVEIVGIQWLNDAVANIAMAFDDGVFIWCEPAGLEQDAIGQTDFTDIMELGRQAEHVDLGTDETNFCRQHANVSSHSHDVAASRVITIFGGTGKALNYLDPRNFQLGGSNTNLLFKLT